MINDKGISKHRLKNWQVASSKVITIHIIFLFLLLFLSIFSKAWYVMIMDSWENELEVMVFYISTATITIWFVGKSIILNNRPFTYLVYIFLVYRMKPLELFYGSSKFMNLVFTTTILFLSVKVVLSTIIRPSYGIIMYSSSLLALYCSN